MQEPNLILPKLQALLATSEDRCYFLARNYSKRLANHNCVHGLLCITIFTGSTGAWIEMEARGHEGTRRWDVPACRKPLANWAAVAEQLTDAGIWTLPDLIPDYRMADGWGYMIAYAVSLASHHGFMVRDVPILPDSAYGRVDQIFMTSVKANFGDPIARRQFLDEPRGFADGNPSSPAGGS